MAHLTNGSVSYERRVKTGDFEHKHAAITIHYALDDGDNENVADQLIALAGSLVTGHVFQILRAAPGAATSAPTAPEPVVPVEVAPVMVPDEVEVIPPAPPVTNLKAARRAAKAKQGPVEIISQTDVVVEESPLVPDPTPGEQVVVPAEVTQIVSEVVDDFTAAAPAATDAELGQVLSRVNTKLKDRLKIQALIGEFVEVGGSYTLIPAVRRAEFVAKLEALS